MKTVLFWIVFAGLAVTWTIEKISAQRMAARLLTLQDQYRTLATLESERERLRALQPGRDELEMLKNRAALQLEFAKDRAARTKAAGLRRGAWSAAREWHNRGQATPESAIETTLWAAAGGDVHALRNVIVLTASTEVAAENLLARLPAATRGLYPTATDLIAAFTTKSIPVGEAQLVWLNQVGNDQATACVFLKNPSDGSGSALLADTARVAAGPNEQSPPQLPAVHETAATYLSLQRAGDNWRLVVPPSAVDKIAQELGYALPTRG